MLNKIIRKIFKKQGNQLTFCENYLGGHINICNITIYGENAMHYGVAINTKKFGRICFRLPFRCFGRWFPLYFYLSPNSTPWASTLYFGTDKRQKRLSKIRKKQFGHNFNTDYICGSNHNNWQICNNPIY